eukprot:3764967-Amphidinium_carterae.1
MRWNGGGVHGGCGDGIFFDGVGAVRCGAFFGPGCGAVCGAVRSIVRLLLLLVLGFAAARCSADAGAVG